MVDFSFCIMKECNNCGKDQTCRSIHEFWKAECIPHKTPETGRIFQGDHSVSELNYLLSDLGNCFPGQRTVLFPNNQSFKQGQIGRKEESREIELHNKKNHTGKKACCAKSCLDRGLVISCHNASILIMHYLPVCRG
jgi:hypothetical protein